MDTSVKQTENVYMSLKKMNKQKIYLKFFNVPYFEHKGMSNLPWSIQQL